MLAVQHGWSQGLFLDKTLTWAPVWAPWLGDGECIRFREGISKHTDTSTVTLLVLEGKVRKCFSVTV